MPRRSQSLPKYRKHRASGQAVVNLAGRDHYLGPHGTQTSRREYDRLVGEWMAQGRPTHPTRSVCDITVVEISEDVIALRDEFCIPKDDHRFRVVHDDGARYVERLDEQMDVLLIDAFDADGIALSLANSDFYSCASRRLAKNGMLVMNFWGPCERYVDNLEKARAAFGDSLLLVPVAGDANVLLFAFKQAPPQAITDELEAIAKRLQMRLLLDFPRYLRRICQGISLSDPRTPAELQIGAAFCLGAESMPPGVSAEDPMPGASIAKD